MTDPESQSILLKNMMSANGGGGTTEKHPRSLEAVRVGIFLKCAPEWELPAGVQRKPCMANQSAICGVQVGPKGPVRRSHRKAWFSEGFIKTGMRSQKVVWRPGIDSTRLGVKKHTFAMLAGVRGNQYLGKNWMKNGARGAPKKKRRVAVKKNFV